VPNTSKYENDNFSATLLNVLDSLKIPFTIFINESKITKNSFEDANKKLLKKWIENDNSIVGNHTYSHSRYSEVGFDSFVKDIERGEILTKEYASLYGKNLKYFRFPYNDLGKDSAQQLQIRSFIKSKNYSIAPFTIESSDWMFNYVYEYYLDKKEFEKAKAIGKHYVDKTIELVKFYEVMSDTVYNRSINHIYLCHDNSINADYLAEITDRLQNENYRIVSFEESLTDPIYQQQDIYYEKWGISWFYRWMKSSKERYAWMRQEPQLSDIEKTYNDILKK
jgi:peptidoglycan/xylan/chitin deacetylase (PgdA/CDA1 family)